MPTFGRTGSKRQLRAKPEQTQTLPTECLVPERAGFAGFALFLNQLKLNCLNSPRAPTKTSSVPGQPRLQPARRSGGLLPEPTSDPGAGSAFQRRQGSGPCLLPVLPRPGAGGSRATELAGSGARALPQVPTFPAQTRGSATHKRLNPSSNPGVPWARSPTAAPPSYNRLQRKGAGGEPARATASGCTTAPGAARPWASPGGCSRARGVRGHPGPSDPMCVLFKGPLTFLLYTTIKLAFTLEPVPGMCWCVRLRGAQGAAPAAAAALGRGRWHPLVLGPPRSSVTSWPQGKDEGRPQRSMSSQSHVRLCWMLPGWRSQKHNTWSLR